MSRRPLIVVCIPAFEEERSIAKVIVKALKHVDKVIVCDDGSRDMTGEIAERLGAEVITHKQNSGYGAALISLFERARKIDPDVMVTLDADNQHSPDDVLRLAELILREEADIVIGSRFLDGSEDAQKEVPRYRKMGIKAITKMASAASYREITDAQSGFRAYSRKAIQMIRPTEQGMGISTEILMKAKESGLKLKEVPVKIDYDVEKTSSHNPFSHGLDVMLSTVKHMSMRRPLLFYGVPGFMSLVIALVFWVWVLQIFAVTREVVTNITLVAIGATIVGLMLLTTAMLLWVLISILKNSDRI